MNKSFYDANCHFCRKFDQMSAFISFKKLALFLLGGLLCAAAVAFLLNFILAGPKLGPVYDFFLSQRQSPPISHEILIINTDEFAESSDIFSVLMTLTEMDASSLILTARVSSSSSPVTGTEAEIRQRFYDEYNLTGSNIRNLFNGIRSGSVPPSQAHVFVDKLVELSDQSRDRLLSALIDRDEDLIRSAAVFGRYMEVETKPEFDKDGKIRRVLPVETESSLEHPVYMSLKNRYAVSQIENTQQGRIIGFRGHDGREWDIPLDKGGNILTAGHGEGFRAVDISLFREYEEAGRTMRRVLKEADELGALSQTKPEKSPLFLEDYALLLREDLLKAQDEKRREAWKTARANYFESLEDFLSGPAESTIVRGYEEVIAGERALKPEGRAKLVNMRDELIRSFSVMRETHREFVRLHEILKNELESAYCIMGPSDSAEYCALMANVLITGSHIRPANDQYVLFWSTAAAFIILLIIFRLRPAALMPVGLFCSLLAAAVFGWNFVLTSYWIDPIIVFSSTLSGMLFIFICKCSSVNRRARRFRIAYGAAVSPRVLQDLILAGKPRPTETMIAAAAVVATKDFNLLSKEDREKSQEAGRTQKTFFALMKKIIFNSGGIIAGYEGDTVIACFGSPLDKTYDPVGRAYTLVKELLKEGKTSWRFGIDAGKCTFSWTPETGFSANGRPVVRARVLASRTARYKVRALVTDAIREETNLNIRKIGSLYGDNDAFYELTGDDNPDQYE
jgi:hypothetical protein